MVPSTWSNRPSVSSPVILKKRSSSGDGFTLLPSPARVIRISVIVLLLSSRGLLYTVIQTGAVTRLVTLWNTIRATDGDTLRARRYHTLVRILGPAAA